MWSQTEQNKGDSCVWPPGFSLVTAGLTVPGEEEREDVQFCTFKAEPGRTPPRPQPNRHPAVAPPGGVPTTTPQRFGSTAEEARGRPDKEPGAQTGPSKKNKQSNVGGPSAAENGSDYPLSGRDHQKHRFPPPPALIRPRLSFLHLALV